MMSTCVAASAEEISDSEGCIVELLANTPFEREGGRQRAPFLDSLPQTAAPPYLWCTQHTARGDVHDPDHKIRSFIATVINVKC
jgi:hypothetical protein